MMKYIGLASVSISLWSCATTPAQDSDEKAIDRVYEQMTTAYKTYNIALIDEIYESDAYNIYGGDTLPIRQDHTKRLQSFISTFDYHKKRKTELQLKFKRLERLIADTICVDVGYFRIDTVDSLGLKPLADLASS